MIERKSVVTYMVLVCKNYNYKEMLWFDLSGLDIFNLPTHKNLYYEKVALELYLLEHPKQVYEVLTSWLQERKQRLQREEFRFVYRVLCAMFEEDAFTYELAYQSIKREFTEDDYNPFTVKQTIKEVEKVLFQIRGASAEVHGQLVIAEKAQLDEIKTFLEKISSSNTVTVTLSPLLQRLLLKQLKQHIKPTSYFAEENKVLFYEVYQQMKNK